MASLRFVWLGMLGALLLTTGCRNVRHATSASLPERSADELLDSLNFREPTWQTLGLRMESSARAMDKEGSFTMNVRMAKDSVIWMSISPALGVEAARVLADPRLGAGAEQASRVAVCVFGRLRRAFRSDGCAGVV